jgi:hypothetical protein
MKGILLFNANVGLEMPTTLAVRATLNGVGVSPISEAILSTRRPMAVSPTYPMERHDVGRIRKTPGRRPRALYAMPALRRDVKLGGSLTSCRSQAATEHSLFRIDKDVSRAFVPPDARPNSKQQLPRGEETRPSNLVSTETAERSSFEIFDRRSLDEALFYHKHRPRHSG